MAGGAFGGLLGCRSAVVNADFERKAMERCVSPFLFVTVAIKCPVLGEISLPFVQRGE